MESPIFVKEVTPIIRRNNGWRRKRGLYLCSCGNLFEALSEHITSRKILSCGCYQKQQASKANIIHGQHKNRKETTGTYWSWSSMIQRCTNSKSTTYLKYGAKGICIEDSRWFVFVNFFTDMGNRPKGTTLDRICGTKGYFKDNCKWSTSKEQNRNTSKNLNIVFNGKEQCLMAHCEELNLTYNTIYRRLFINHWPVEKALTIPIRKKKQNNHVDV